MDKVAFIVEFRLLEDESIDSELLGPQIDKIFQYCGRFMNLQQAAIERVVIVNPSLMSEVIHEFQDLAGRLHGHSEGYFQTAGKVIPRALEDCSIVNTLIIDLRIMLELIKVCQQNIPIEKWSIDARFWFSVLAETVGHCIDNAVRRNITDRTLDPEVHNDNITLSKYYAPIVAGQFVSGVLAGPCISLDLQNRKIDHWQLSAKQLVDPLMDRRVQNSGASDFASSVAHSFWAILFQYATLVGHTVSNPRLGGVNAWRSSNKDFVVALNDLALDLKQLWEEYPNLPSDEAIAELILPSWQKLTEAYGFVFGTNSSEVGRIQMSISSSSTEHSGIFYCAGTTSLAHLCNEEFFEEHDEKQYCALHFPGEDKKEAFEKALERKFSVKDFNFQGVWFPDVVSFHKTTFNESADFSDTYFNNVAIFYQPQFEGAVGFRAAHFSKDVGFSNALFLNADFSSAKFDAPAEFDGAQFKEDATFRGAHFKEEADFTLACFYKDVDFGKAMFDTNVYFNGTRFIEEVLESKDSDSTEKSIPAVTDSEAETKTKMISFDGARFRDGLSFERNDFAIRTNVSFGAAIFDKPDRVIFHSVILQPYWFINIDPRKFNFVSVSWGFLEKRGAIKREFQSLARSGKGYLSQLLTVTFRQLAVNAEDNNRYVEAANFRYMAMDAQRLERWRKIDLFRLSWWYWLLSGYGERVQRAFGMLFLFWIIFAGIYWFGNATWWQPKEVSKTAIETVEGQQLIVSQALTLPESLVYSLGVMTLQKPEPKPANKRCKVFTLLETVVGPLQAALLALAMRRKFMR